MLANNTAINDFWMVLNKKFDLMNRKRSFWHHYVQEGMPEEDFAEFREDLAALGILQGIPTPRHLLILIQKSIIEINSM